MAPRSEHSALTLNWPFLLAVIVVFLALKRLYWELTVGTKRRQLSKQHGCQPVNWHPHKGVLGYFFGYDTVKQNLDAYKQGDLFETIRCRNFAKHNTLMLANVGRNMLTTIEPENVKTMLSLNFQDYGVGNVRISVMEPVFGKGIFTTDGKDWEHSRAMIRPSFTRQQVADFAFYERHLQHMLTHIPRDGSTVDLQELFFRLTMDSATEYLFGKSTNTLIKGSEDPDAIRYADAFTYVTECMAQDFRSGRLTRFLKNPKRKDDSEFLVKFSSDIVNKAIVEYDKEEKGLKEKQRNYTFLYELLKITRDPYILRSEALNILLAGRDTTASLLGHVFYEISRRPQVWAKLHAEVDELGGDLPDYESLKSLKYVRWVLNETLRLKPVVPGTTRVAIRDTVLPRGGGLDERSPILVPEGTVVTYSVWSMHRRKDLFGEDAFEFNPDRFATLRTSWEYLPFTGGPRVCIGQNFALTEASYVLVRMLQHFRRIEPRDNGPWKEAMTFTLATRDGVNVGLYEQ